MKVQLTFKTPDVMDQLIPEPLRYGDTDNSMEFVKRWLQYNELITVEFDSIANTATVILP